MKNKNVTRILCALIVSAVSAPIDLSAQSTFQKTFGGVGQDMGYAVVTTSDSGYLIAGETTSFGAGSRDVYLIRTDQNGAELWSKTYGGTNVDYARAAIQTTDGGFLIGAHTDSYGAGEHDILLIKTNGNGDLEWSKTIGGPNPDGAYRLFQISGGGFVVAAHTGSFGEGAHEFFLIKTCPFGGVIWTRTYGENGEDKLQALTLAGDGGYVIGGFTESTGPGDQSACLIKTDQNGDTLWVKTYGSLAPDQIYAVMETADGGVLAVGSIIDATTGTTKALLIKTDENGNLIFAKKLEAAENVVAFDAILTADEGCIIVGNTSDSNGEENGLMIKTNADGNILWSRTFPFDGNSYLRSVGVSADNGYIATGWIYPDDGNEARILILKTDSAGNSACSMIVDNAMSKNLTLEVAPWQPTVGIFAVWGIDAVVTAMSDSPAADTITCETVGLQQLQFSGGVQLYPNPFHHTATLQILSPEILNGNVDVVMLDLLGREVKRMENIQSEKVTIQRGNLPDGLYLFRLENGDGVMAAGKVVVD
jgi:hypothetical protein